MKEAIFLNLFELDIYIIKSINFNKLKTYYNKFYINTYLKLFRDYEIYDKGKYFFRFCYMVI